MQEPCISVCLCWQEPDSFLSIHNRTAHSRIAARSWLEGGKADVSDRLTVLLRPPSRQSTVSLQLSRDCKNLTNLQSRDYLSPLPSVPLLHACRNDSVKIPFAIISQRHVIWDRPVCRQVPPGGWPKRKGLLATPSFSHARKRETAS